ncbi:MAG: PaaI family thioesterase [Bacteroidota bacterium]
MTYPTLTPKDFNERGEGRFPGFLGIEILEVSQGLLRAKMDIRPEFFAPNGFLHAGSIVTLADTVAGYATMAHLPENAKSFTTLELKSNFLGAARDGFIECEARPEHMGRTTQVWKVDVRHGSSQKKVAVFSCTQLVLY